MVFNSLLAKDIFGGFKRKPWWEKIRVIIILVSGGLAIYFFTDVGITTSIHCIPKNGSEKLTLAQMNYANAGCNEKLHHWLKAFPFMNLVIIFFLFLIDLIWSLIPRVQHTFKTLSDIDERVKSLRGSVPDIREVVRRMVEGKHQIELAPTDQDLRALKKICEDLWSPNKGFPTRILSISMLYVIRNVISCVLNGIWLYNFHSITIKNNLPCYLENSKVREFNCTISQRGHAKHVLQFMTVMQWVFATVNILSVFLSPASPLRCVKHNKTHSAFILNGVDVVLYVLYAVFVNRLSAYLTFFVVALLSSFNCVVHLRCSMNLPDGHFFVLYCIAVVENMIMYGFSFVPITFWKTYWFLILVIHHVIIAFELRHQGGDVIDNLSLCQPVRGFLGRENDNRLALSFLQQLSRPINRDTIAILFPSKLSDDIQTIEDFLNPRPMGFPRRDGDNDPLDNDGLTSLDSLDIR